MGKRNNVPNQRHITINKALANKKNIYTVNNISAIDEAANRLQSKGGFKLYMYLAKNQDKHDFYLYSSDFTRWAGIGMTAYNTAFEELEEEGYLVRREDTKTIYTFYDKSQKPIDKRKEKVLIEIPVDKVEEVKQLTKAFVF